MRITARQLLKSGPAISVGMLTADLLRLGDQLAVLDQAGASLVHIDVMDGVFCPQLTFGPPIVQAIPDRFVKDCHLMIDEPVDKLNAYIDAGADIITFHVESTRHPHRVLQSLAGTGVIRGVALAPGTPLDAVEPLIDDLDLLLLLAINPGWSGQKFQPTTERRVVAARELIEGREIVLGLDGGITRGNIGYVASLGADLVVSGSAVYDGIAPLDNARRMLQAVGAGHSDLRG